MSLRPNILFITLDQWRADALGDGTPALAALAQDATVFTRHYCQAFPCGPARASLMTGLYAEQHGIRHNDAVLDPQHPTLFQLLRSAGYDPTLFGYTDVSDASDASDVMALSTLRTDSPAERPTVRCNGLNVDTPLNDDAALWITHLRAQGYTIAADICHRDAIFALRRFDEPALFDAAHSEAAFLTDRFLQWLPPRGDAPFCAHLSYISPHPPFAAPAPFHHQYVASEQATPCRGASPAIEAAQHPFMQGLLNHVDVRKFVPGLAGLAQTQSLDTIQRVKAVYAGQVSQVDAQLGRLFDALRARDQWENTVIVVTADHGEQLFDHWLLGKTGYFDQSAHVPLIIRLPDTENRTEGPAEKRNDPPISGQDGKQDPTRARGRQVHAFTESIDLFPTLLALVDAPTHYPSAPAYEGEGRDLLPWCRGKTPALWRDEVRWQFDFAHVANGRLSKALGLTPALSRLDVVRTDRLKYVDFAGMSPVLFDLAADPLESINRAHDVGAKALLAEGYARWDTWQDRLAM